MSAATALTIVGVTISLGLALAAWLVIMLRRKTFWGWAIPFRVAFLVTVGTFAIFGAGLWIALWFERGFWLGIGQFILMAVVFWQSVIAPWRASASPATHSPPPTA